MKYLILSIGMLIGSMATLFVLNNFPWFKLFSITILKAFFTVFLALMGGVIALYQVKANVISSARIKWIEEFKKDVSEYTATTHAVIFSYIEYIDAEDTDRKKAYHKKYMEEVTKSVAIRNRILMNLNRKEQYYERIYQIINKIEELTEYKNLEFIADEKNYNIIEKEFNNLSTVTNQVMKQEWEKAKKLFFNS